VRGAALRESVLAFDPSVPIARARTPPSAWYFEPEVHELELASTFARAWRFVARADQVAAPGAWVGGLHPRAPWLVTRGHDGVLRAFHNACRHKATPVALGEGTCDELVCPYHGWRYRLDGALRSAPRIAGVEGFDRARMGLSELRVATWGPLVLVCQDPSAPSPAEALAPLTARLDATGWGDLLYHGRKVWDVACNWKVFVDNYLDGGYHIPHLHPSLDAQLDMGGYVTEVFDTWSLQSSPASARADADAGLAISPAERIGGGALYAWVHPNLMINRYGPALDTNLVLPIGPERCQVIFDFWFDPAVAEDADFVAATVAQSDVTQREDIDVSERVQHGLSSPGYDRGPYAPQVEIGVHHFHRLLAADLRAALGEA